jgi:hypothetical protein
MSRIASGDMVTTRPTNNVYTALAAAGTVVVLTGLILFFLKASEVLGPDNSLFS